MVDGLDELPDQHQRTELLAMLASTAEAAPYRFLVATRPLPGHELAALGGTAPRYELLSFTASDLRAFAEKWFTHDTAETFISAVRAAQLGELARTPLMAFMLCHTHRPDRPLPSGRSGVYQEFVKRLYETNSHKDVARTQQEALHALAGQYQNLDHRRTAEKAALRALHHLPEIINYFAHERLHGNQAPAVEVAASHPQAARPAPVTTPDWHRFLSDLMRPTGLLTQRADDFVFLHPTLQEYLAARHAARDEQECAALLDRLFPPGRPRPPDGQPSYLGFLLDTLLACPGDIAAETTDRKSVV